MVDSKCYFRTGVLNLIGNAYLSVTIFHADVTSWPSSVSTGLGPMEPDGQHSHHAAGACGGGGVASAGANGKKAAVSEDKDTPPRQSLECLEYLKRMQEFQVRMIAIRVSS